QALGLGARALTRPNAARLLTFSSALRAGMIVGLIGVLERHGMAQRAADWSLTELQEVIADTWGYRELRPLQEEAMAAVLDRRDSLVVLPTGGGKSLCYQAPAVYRGGTTVVISPLIALMKDQVDSLRSVGVPAAQFDSTLTLSERTNSVRELRQGNLRLA